MATKIDTSTELKVIAMLARGDSMSAISEEIGISHVTVANIKKRNPDTLAIVKTKLVERQSVLASRILAKANAKIEQRLDEDDNKDSLTRMSVKDLTSISHELFNQRQVEEGNPTSISASDPKAREAFDKLKQAIKNGDTVELQRLVLNPPDDNN